MQERRVASQSVDEGFLRIGVRVEVDDPVRRHERGHQALEQRHVALVLQNEPQVPVDVEAEPGLQALTRRCC